MNRLTSPVWGVLAFYAILVLVAGVLARVDAAAAPAPKEIVAQRFRVVDAAGKTRAVLGYLEEGGTKFILCDSKARVGAEIHLAEDGAAAIWLRDTKQTVRGGLKIEADGSVSFWTFGPTGQPLSRTP